MLLPRKSETEKEELKAVLKPNAGPRGFWAQPPASAPPVSALDLLWG